MVYTAVQSSINVQIQKLLYSVFNRSSVKFKLFCIYYTTFYTNFFFKHQCSNFSPSPPRCKWNRLFKKRGVLHNISVSSHCIFSFFFFFNIGVMIPHSVTAAAHRPVLWLTVIGVKSGVKSSSIYGMWSSRFRAVLCCFSLDSEVLITGGSLSVNLASAVLVFCFFC